MRGAVDAEGRRAAASSSSPASSSTRKKELVIPAHYYPYRGNRIIAFRDREIFFFCFLSFRVCVSLKSVKRSSLLLSFSLILSVLSRLLSLSLSRSLVALSLSPILVFEG